MILYHGTQIQNIKQLKPFSTKGNAISKPVICFTPNYCTALLYIWNRSYKWVSFSENEDNKVVFIEHFDNMLFDFYNNIKGSIYECGEDNNAIAPTHMKGVFTSDIPVKVEKETQIDNVYDEIVKQESLGNIIVKRYNQLSDDEKNKIFKQIVRAIHMQKLLLPSDNLSQKDQSNFIKTHFPKAWDFASKMTAEEVNYMINEWRASLK